MPRAAKQHKTSRAAAKPPRPQSSQRGYDAAWRRLRNAYISEHPLCEHCRAVGLIVPAREVDHVVAFGGPEDPLRLEWRNLQALCRRCHAQKTAKEQA